MDRVNADGLELLGPDGILTELTSKIARRLAPGLVFVTRACSESLGWPVGRPAICDYDMRIRGAYP